MCLCVYVCVYVCAAVKYKGQNNSSLVKGNLHRSRAQRSSALLTALVNYSTSLTCDRGGDKEKRDGLETGKESEMDSLRNTRAEASQTMRRKTSLGKTKERRRDVRGEDPEQEQVDN